MLPPFRGNTVIVSLLCHYVSLLCHYCITIIDHMIFSLSQRLYPSIIHSARGTGTFCAISCKDGETRDNLAYALRQKGEISCIGNI